MNAAGGLEIGVFITAGFTLLGVCIAAVMQYLFSRRAGMHKSIEDARARAYKDYINAVALFSMITNKKEAIQKANDAATRIAVFGSKNVIEAMGDFVKIGDLGKREGQIAFTRVIEAMRVDTVGGKNVASEKSIRALLFHTID